MTRHPSSPPRALAWLAALAIVAFAAPADARRKKKPKPKPVAKEEPAPKEIPPTATPDSGGGDAGVPATPAVGTTPATPTTPAPPPPPAPVTPAADEASSAVDVDGLRQEYLKLRDELFESRARAATVASALYSTRVTVRLTFTTGRFYGVTHAIVRLDGASVFDDTTGAIANDDAARFDGWIAPGRHVLTFRVETVGKDDERFTSATETTVVVQAVAGKDLTIAGKAADGGDIAYEWKKKERGSYKLGIDVDVHTTARAAEPDARSDGKKAASK